MEFGNPAWVNPASAEPGGFGGVPKDDIWGHPKLGGFGGTQGPAGGMMATATQGPSGPNPYQQQFAQEPKAGMDSFAYQPGVTPASAAPSSFLSNLQAAPQHPPHPASQTQVAPAFQDAFQPNQRPLQGATDFRFGMQQTMPEAPQVKGFREPESRAFHAPAATHQGVQPQPQTRQEGWPHTPPTFSNQFAQPFQQQQAKPPQNELLLQGQPAPAQFAPQPGLFGTMQDLPQQQAPFAQPGQMGAQFQPQGPQGPQGPQETRQCQCGQTASQFTVKKEGPNQGRPFWKCSSCGSFDWADEPPRQGGQGGPGPVPGQPPPVADGPPCHCQQPSVGLTVRKDGPNQGRPFFGCAQRICQFFQWADEEPPAPGPPCLCGVASLLRKVQKDGPNRGRPFHVCERKACQFFAWADEDPASKGSLPTPARAAPRGGPDVGGNGNLCFHCNQPGHWASNCPNKGAPAGKRGRGRGRGGGGRGRGRKALGPHGSGDFDDFGDFPDTGARYAPF